MSFNVNWKIEKRVILCKLTGTLTIEDIRQGNEQVRQYVAEGQNPIHTVMDLQHLKDFPMKFDVFKSGYPLSNTDGWLVLIGGSATVKFATNLVVHMVGSKLKRVETPEEAYQFLDGQDPTL